MMQIHVQVRLAVRQGVDSNMSNIQYLIHKHLIICSKIDCPMNRDQRCICYPCIESINNGGNRTGETP